MVLLAIFIVLCSILYEQYDKKVLYPKRLEELKKRKKELGIKNELY